MDRAAPRRYDGVYDYVGARAQREERESEGSEQEQEEESQEEDDDSGNDSEEDSEVDSEVEISDHGDAWPSDSEEEEVGHEDAQGRRPTAPPPRRTLADIKLKRCFICYDEEENSEQNGARTIETEWVHACRCILIAHNQCLLTWIAQWEQTHQGSAPKCPACQYVFQLREPRSRALLGMTILAKLWRVSSIGIAGFATIAGLYAGMGAYGKWAIQQFAGKEVADLVTSRRGVPWYARLTNGTPFIPIILVVSRTASIDSIFPFIPLGFILSSLSSYPSRSMKNDILGLPHLSPSFPPSPAFLAAMFPWLRLAYLKARARVFKAVNLEVSNWYDTIFQEPEVPVGVDQLLQPHELVSLGKMCSMTVEAFLFPLASACVGSSLLYLSTRSRTSKFSLSLRQLLCVQLPTISTSRFGFGWGMSEIGTDPIWVRNTLGGGIVLVLRDGVQLVHGILRRRRIERRRIVGRDFSSKLDLNSQ